MQKSVSKDTEEEDDTGGINLDKAKERLQEEDKFDKEEYRKKIKAKHRVSFFHHEFTQRNLICPYTYLNIHYIFINNHITVLFSLTSFLVAILSFYLFLLSIGRGSVY